MRSMLDLYFWNQLINETNLSWCAIILGLEDTGSPCRSFGHLEYVTPTGSIIGRWDNQDQGAGMANGLITVEDHAGMT